MICVQCSQLFFLILVTIFYMSSALLPEFLSNLGKQLPDEENLVETHTFGRNAFIDPDDKITGERVAELNITSNQNPEELGEYFEGDIRMPFHFNGRNGFGVGQSTRWPNGVVPYEIAGNFNFNELAAINLAFEEYHKRTCIRFKPRTRERDYISIVNGRSGCWSAVGRVGGKQEVNLQSPQCLMKRGTPLHELMHVLGFIHEQNRYERDSYVVVRFENIRENMEVNFVKSSQPSGEQGLGIGYDYMSVMHYSPTTFSKNGHPTIQARKITRESRNMGQRFGFSRADVARINLMYSCRNTDVLEDPGNELELKKVND